MEANSYKPTYYHGSSSISNETKEIFQVGIHMEIPRSSALRLLKLSWVGIPRISIQQLEKQV